MMHEKALIVFQGKNIRRTWHNEEWWFVVEDIVSVLTNASDPKDYINKMRKRDEVLSKGYGQIVHPLPMETKGGIQNINCTNTAGAFRIIQSIPSPKAEPFKLWLAQVGYERVQEIENPELAQQRMKEIYKAKGYSSEWIEKRMRGIAIRSELTDEWRKRGVVKPSEYAILMAEIAKATFGLLPSEHKSLKNLTTQNLRDHMDDIELILSILGEATTTRFTRERDSQIFPALEQDAQEGGTVAGATRKDIEKRLGKSIVSAENFLQQPERRKRLAKR